VKTSGNSLLAIAALALQVGRRCMSAYAHAKSPKTFTQPQLLACLVVKANLKLTYRGIVQVLEISPALRQSMGLRSIPHYTTLQKFAASDGVLLVLDAVLAEIVLQINDGEPLRTKDVAIDATGMESSCASAHFVSRAGKKRSRWVRVSVVAICTGVLPVAMHIDWGPGNDAAPALGLLQKAAAVVKPEQVWGDAAYDSDSLHAFCHEHWGARSYAPPILRRNSSVIRGRYRPAMREQPADYGRRWTIESLFSAVKRVCGSALTARREHTLKVEAALRVVAYGIRR
jgi:hypothetical protein